MIYFKIFLFFKTAILKKGIRTPLGILNGILANQITWKKYVYYIIG